MFAGLSPQLREQGHDLEKKAMATTSLFLQLENVSIAIVAISIITIVTIISDY